MSVGELQGQLRDSIEWRIPRYSRILYSSRSYASDTRIFRGVTFKFVHANARGYARGGEFGYRLIGISFPERRQLGSSVISEDFRITIAGRYEEVSYSRSGADLIYSPEHGWFLLIHENRLKEISDSGDSPESSRHSGESSRHSGESSRHSADSGDSRAYGDFGDLTITWTLIPTVIRELKDDLMDLFHKETGKVINLEAKGSSFQAHKAILRARSTVLGQYLLNSLHEPRHSEPIYIDDCDRETFHDFLKYLYSGNEKIITVDNVRSLYKTANTLGVKKLMKDCERFMVRGLSVATFITFLTFAFENTIFSLLDECSDFYNGHSRKIKQESEWKSFAVEADWLIFYNLLR